MVRNANNFKRRTKLKTITKNNHQKKKKFNQYSKKLINNNIKIVNLNASIAQKKSNKYSDAIKKSKGFSNIEINVIYKKFKSNICSMLMYDYRRRKITNSILKNNTKKLSIICLMNSVINKFKN